MDAIANITYEFDEKNGNGSKIATAEIIDTDTWDEYGTFTLPISNPTPEYYSDTMTDSDMETWVAIAESNLKLQILDTTLHNPFGDGKRYGFQNVTVEEDNIGIFRLIAEVVEKP